MDFPKPYKWEFPKMCKRPDTIASSDYAGVTPFVASCQTDKTHSNMFFLLSMEYARIWHKELKEYQEFPVIKKPESKPELIRPQVMRSYMRMQRQQSGQKELFKLKRFKNIPAKTNSYLKQSRGLKKGGEGEGDEKEKEKEKKKKEEQKEIEKTETKKKSEVDKKKAKRCNIWRRDI